MRREPAPPVTQELIDWLSAIFPNRCPRLEDSEREIWTDVGSARVVTRLIAEHKRQQENPFSR